VSFGPAITATIGADVGPLAASGPQVDGAVDKIAGRLEHRLFGARELSRTLATALGLNLEKMAEHVAAFVFGVTEAAKKSYEEMVTESAKAADLVEQQLRGRRGQSQAPEAAEQRLLSLRKQALDLQKTQAEAAARVASIEEKSSQNLMGSLIGRMFLERARNMLAKADADLAKNAYEQQQAGGELDALKVKNVEKLVALDQTNFEHSLRDLPLQEQLFLLTERKKKLQGDINGFKGVGLELDAKNAALAQTALLLTDARAKRQKESGDEYNAQEKEQLKLVQANRELLLLTAKEKRGITQEEQARLNILRLQQEQLSKNSDIDRYLMIELARPLTQEELKALEALQNQNTVLTNQIAIQQQIVDKVKEEAKERKEITTLTEDEARAKGLIKNGAMSLQSYRDVYLGPSRDKSDFSQSSDAVIQEEIRRYKEQEAQIKAKPLDLAEAAGNYYTRNLAISQLQRNIDAGMSALQERSDYRKQDFSTSLRGYQGDPLNFDQLYQQAQQNAKAQDLTTQAITSLSNKLTSGIPVVIVGGSPKTATPPN